MGVSEQRNRHPAGGQGRCRFSMGVGGWDWGRRGAKTCITRGFRPHKTWAGGWGEGVGIGSEEKGKEIATWMPLPVNPSILGGMAGVEK